MGVYENYTYGPVTKNDDGTETLQEFQHWPGHTNVRTITRTAWTLHERTDCYCCSCGHREGSDPYCRNHGFAAERPCEVHKMAGVPDEDGKMPVSVQQVYRDLEASRAHQD